ncbi:hypothetical protein KKI24_11630 [bacterium]|nr:hypothetical protein [bacterium]
MPKKFPVNLKTGSGASSTNLSDWTSYDDAVKAYQSGEYEGLGFCFDEGDGLVGIDLDDCIDQDTGAILPAFQEIVSRFDSYTERSPSGKGFHIIIKGDIPTLGKDEGGYNQKPYEIYARKRFFTVTGDHVPGTPATVEARQEAIDWFLENFIDTKKKLKANIDEIPEWWAQGPLSITDLAENESAILNTVLKDERAKKLYEGDWSDYPSQSEGDMAFAVRLAKPCKCDPNLMDNLFRTSGLYREKYDRASYGLVTLAKAIKSKQIDFTAVKHQDGRKDFEKQVTDAGNDFDSLMTIASSVWESHLPQTSKERLVKDIARAAGVPVGSLRTDLKKKQGAESVQKQHHATALAAIERYGKENILYTLGCFWTWDGTGVWKSLEDRAVKKVIHEVADRDKISQAFVSSVLDLAKTECNRSIKFDSNPRGINCLNGLLVWNGSGFDLQEHSRRDYLTVRIPVEYDPETPAPRFERFLEEIFEIDDEREAKIKLILEIAGYCLLSSTELEKFVIMLGSGANGKSVLLKTLESLVGAENVAAVQPDQFANKFQIGYLRGKLLNSVTEIAVGTQIADARLKAIASGESLTAEQKYGDPFNFEPFATCIFATNHMPHTRDFSEALMRRAIIINFNRVFRPEEQDKHLVAKLKEELRGILNLALEGLTRLFKNGDCTHVAECEEAKRAWQLESDQAAQFVEEECIIGTAYSVESGVLYRAYERWASRVGVDKRLKQRNLTIRLQRFGVVAGKGGKGVRQLSGIALAPDAVSIEEEWADAEWLQ